MRAYPFALALVLSLPVSHAWTGRTISSSPPALDRRGFLSTSAAATVVGTATVLVSSPVSPASAASSIKLDPVYQPTPHSLDNQVILITGATTGLGLESAKRLAAGGATVILTSRTKEKGDTAVKNVRQYLSEHECANDNVFSVTLDLDDLDNVKAFPQRLQQQVPLFSASTSSGNTNTATPKIDVLLNNAGVMAIPDRQITKDGYERTFQSNHLGHFVLTSKLFPMLNDDARVINVSSSAHQIAGKGLDLNNLNGERDYGPWTSYGQSKLENILFTKELQRRANQAGRSVTAISLHPGAVQTDLSRYMMGTENYEKMKTETSWKSELLQKALNTLGVMPVEKGATTQVWLAAGQGEGVAGTYVENCRVVKPAGAASDMDKAKELWAVSEKLGGVDFKI